MSYADTIRFLYLDGYGPGVNPLDGYIVLDSVNSAPMPLHHFLGFSITVSCPATGSPSGTVKLQGCNDAERNEGKPDATLTNWFDIASGGARLVSGSITNASTIQLTDPQAFYRWVRLVYTRTSGTVTLTAKIQRKTVK